MKKILLLIVVSISLGYTQEVSDSVTIDSAQAVQSDSLTVVDSVGVEKSEKRIKPQIRTYDHRTQVLLAAGMMAFIAIVLSTAQAWNPD